MDAVKENYKAIAGLVAEAQFERVQNGESQHDARVRALAEVGASLNPPVPGPELEYWMGQCLSEMASGRLAPYSPRQTRKAKPVRVIPFEKYKEWCVNHNHVAKDAELAHWTGKHLTVFSHARQALARMGFTFERDKHGWKITGKPADGRVYSEEEVKAMLDKLAEEMKSKFYSEMKGK